MKVYIGKYPHLWVSYVYEKHMLKKYGRYEWEDSSTNFERALEKLEDTLQWIYNATINRILANRQGQKIKVRIDKWDTYSADHTLSHIIAPILTQLELDKQSAPLVADEDVPEDLRSANAPPKENDWDVDSFHFNRWDWVVREMIWAFEQNCRDDWQDDYYGEYVEDQKNGPMAGSFEWVDHDGMKAHQERMSNGFRLFGKYFESLWT